MSDRSGFSLSWRLNLTSAAILLIAGLGVVLLVNRSQRDAALQIAEERARGILERNLSLHGFLNEELKPAVFSLPGGRDAAFDPRWMSSSYAIRRIEARSHEGGQRGLEYREAAIDARHPESEADPVERAFLEDARRDPGLVYRASVREIHGEPYFEVLRRGEVSTESCLRCHGEPAGAPPGLVADYGAERAFGWRPGTLVSAVSIRVPLAAAYASANRFSLQLTAGITAVLLAALLAQLLAQRRLVLGPLGELRREVARLAAGATEPALLPLPGARELRELTVAFAAMEGSVARRRAELERAVASRTAELQAANDALAHTNRELERAASERAAAEAMLRQAHKMEAVGRLAGGVAHDFNNLLTAIGGACAELRDGLPEGDPRLEPVEEIRAAASRAAALTRQLLAFGRQDVVRPRVFDVCASLEDTARLLRRLLREDVTLAVSRCDREATVEVDPVHLEQVLVNLVVNARDAMPAGGRVSLEVRCADGVAPADGLPPSDWVVLSVRDEGVGMDPETLARAFDPFFTTKGPGGGTGLGLATVYAVTRGFGGHVVAESAPGAGSTFTVWIPRSSRPAPPAERPAPPAAGAPSGGAPPRREGLVLVVEDEATVRRVVTRTLAQRGWEVLEAEDGEAALRLLDAHRERIAVLVTDLVMPRMGGVELVRRARATPLRAGVVYMSGHADDASRRHAAAAGVFVQKPFAPEELAEAVTRAARQAGQASPRD